MRLRTCVTPCVIHTASPSTRLAAPPWVSQFHCALLRSVASSFWSSVPCPDAFGNNPNGFKNNCYLLPWIGFWQPTIGSNYHTTCHPTPQKKAVQASWSRPSPACSLHASHFPSLAFRTYQPTEPRATPSKTSIHPGVSLHLCEQKKLKTPIDLNDWMQSKKVFEKNQPKEPHKNTVPGCHLKYTDHWSFNPTLFKVLCLRGSHCRPLCSSIISPSHRFTSSHIPSGVALEALEIRSWKASKSVKDYLYGN